MKNVKINISGLDGNYSVNLIPKDFFVKEYVPDELSKLLSKRTSAPPFTLFDLNEKKISLQNLKGKTVILVSHTMDIIQKYCKRSAYLKKGELIFFGETAKAVEIYQQDNQ